jgi:hypothetical protein
VNRITGNDAGVGERCVEPGDRGVQNLGRRERLAIFDLVIHDVADRNPGTEALAEVDVGVSRECVHLRDAGVSVRIGA